MKILVDHNIPGVAETFSHHGEVCKADGRQLHKDQLAGVRALIVRSVTPVNSGLLEGTAVRFVGSATIGTDHMDIPWLERHGIRWASAPGCNADAAAQYTLAMMLLASQRLGFSLPECDIGIVGHGNVGSRVHRLLMAYGVKSVRVCDPPLAEAGAPDLCGLEEIKSCDIVTLHVPLTTLGRHATLGLVDEQFLFGLRPGTLLVNTSRGKVMQKRPLDRWLTDGRGEVALDVWPGEPDIDLELLDASIVATPHVAGYSLDGKLRGTEMVYAQFCDWLKVKPANRDLVASLGFQSPPATRFSGVNETILTACPVARDDAQLRKIAAIGPEQRPVFFDALRRNYPARRDFAGWKVLSSATGQCVDILKSLGFQ